MHGSTLVAATWVWWQAAISAAFGAIFGFLGAYANKRLDERRARPLERLKRACDAIGEATPEVLDRLDGLLATPGDLHEGVGKSPRFLATSAHEAFDNALEDLGASLRAADREMASRVSQVGWALLKARLAWDRAHGEIVQKPHWEAVRRKAESVGWLDREEAEPVDQDQRDEVDELLVQIAQREQQGATLWALLSQLQELRAGVVEVAKIAGEAQRRYG